MTDDLLTSDRLDLRQEAGYAVVSVRNSRFRFWLAAFSTTLLGTLILAWDLWRGFQMFGQDFSQISAGAFGLMLALAIATWQKLNLSRKNACRLVVTEDLITIDRMGLLGKVHQPIASSSIDAVTVEPDTFSRPFDDYPYRRKNHHVRLRHAGEDIRLFKGLTHAEALTIAAAVLPGTSCPRLVDHATTPHVPALSNVVSLETNGTERAPGESNPYIQWSEGANGTVIGLRPHFDRSALVLCVLLSVNMAILVTSSIGLGLGAAHMVFLTLVATLLSGIFLRFGNEAFRRETITLSEDTMRHGVKKLTGVLVRTFQTACISNVSITATTDKVFVDSDFENRSIFQVCFDYGQTTRTVGCRMTYAEAKTLKELLTNTLNERRQAA